MIIKAELLATNLLGNSSYLNSRNKLKRLSLVLIETRINTEICKVSPDLPQIPQLSTAQNMTAKPKNRLIRQALAIAQAHVNLCLIPQDLPYNVTETYERSLYPLHAAASFQFHRQMARERGILLRTPQT